jgi:hypothetical protein
VDATSTEFDSARIAPFFRLLVAAIWISHSPICNACLSPIHSYRIKDIVGLSGPAEEVSHESPGNISSGDCNHTGHSVNPEHRPGKGVFSVLVRFVLSGPDAAATFFCGSGCGNFSGPAAGKESKAKRFRPGCGQRIAIEIAANTKLIRMNLAPAGIFSGLGTGFPFCRP